MMGRHDTRRRSGVALMVVLFFSLMLTASIASFQRQTVMDAMIVRNREDAAQAEALARGGVRIGQALLGRHGESIDRMLEVEIARPRAFCSWKGSQPRSIQRLLISDPACR